MVLAHFREVGLRLCCYSRFVPSTESLCDRLGRDLQVHLESPGKVPKDYCWSMSAGQNLSAKNFCVRQIESWLLNCYGH